MEKNEPQQAISCFQRSVFHSRCQAISGVSKGLIKFLLMYSVRIVSAVRLYARREVQTCDNAEDERSVLVSKMIEAEYRRCEGGVNKASQSLYRITSCSNSLL